MNLKERFEVVMSNYNDTAIVAEPINNGHYQLRNLVALREALRKLGELDLFVADVKEISEGTNLFKSGGEGLVIIADEYNFLSRKIADIQSKSRYIIEFFDEVKTGEDVLEIKLPPNATSFDELSKVAGQLKTAFERPVHSMGIDGGVVEIISAEPGSVWLIVKFGAALGLVAKLLNKAIFVNNEIQKSAANDTYLKQIGASQETLEQMQQLAVKHLQVVTEAQAKEIAEGTVKANDPEVIRTLELALKTIGELQDKGAKFLPASKDPNVISMFPKADAAQLPFDPAKQLA